MSERYDVVIVGAGPAGLTAAIYASRANLSVLIIEAGVNGGKLSKTYEIENYPGIKSISGLELANQLTEHGQQFGAKLIAGEVRSIEEGEILKVKLADGTIYEAKAVIIATGTKERTLDLPHADEFTGRGISYCAVCDGFFYRKKQIAIIGGGNSALEEALYLASLAEKVTIIGGEPAVGAAVAFSGHPWLSIPAAMAAGVLSILAAAALLIVWPLLFKGLIALGESIAGLGNFGAALYAFLNRLLIPTGLHHALNNVFWFDTIGLGDLTHFWAGDTSADVTWSLGMYMSGFFPAMMFGVPGAALAIVRSAKPEKKKAVMGIMLSSAVCAFVCGVTEPFEFAFMFLSPVLYLFYALLYGVVTFVALASGFRAGFSFSGGVTDLIFSSSLPAAARTYMILPLGLLAFVLFYAVFRFFILKWDLKTPGREDEAAAPPGAKAKRAVSDCARQAGMILKGLGGAENVVSIDHCVTRLRLELKDASRIDEAAILAAGAPGVIRMGKNAVQVVVGTSVQFVAEELQKQCASVSAGAEEAPDEQGASASADPKEAAGTRAHRMISHLDDIFTDPVTDGGFDFVMTRAEGIHARPAGAIAKMAAAYDCEITVSADGRTCSARQMTELMALGTSKGTAVHVRAAGNDAVHALSALKAYMEENL